jgi:hypothetical protein
MRSLRLVSTLAVALIVFALQGGRADAHGGLPITLRILRVPGSDTMYVPVHYWGIWVGKKGGPWRWICEEAINAERFRRYAVSADGTYYATNTKGLSFSRQDGCEWPAATGELATLTTKDVATDPVDGKTAWVAAGSEAIANVDGSRTPQANGLFVTHDHGDSFARAAGIGTTGRTIDSVRVAPTDGKVVYATSTNFEPPFDHLIHRSLDGGATFASADLSSVTGQGTLATLEVMAVDPRDPSVIFARANVGSGDATMQLLLRVANAGDAGQSAVLIHAVPVASLSGNYASGINDLAFDLAHDTIFVATGTGLLRGSFTSLPIALSPLGTLSQAQCVDVAGDELSACSWAYSPDFAALAAGSVTGTTLTPFFQFQDTTGPIECPAGTGVQNVCPDVWATYAFQLGIGESDDLGVDAASDGGQPGGGACECAMGRGSAGGAGAALAIALGLVVLLLRRRIAR